MHKTATLALAILGVAAICSAQEVGIGISLKQGENTFYLPVKTSHGMLIEGYVSYFHNSQTNSNPDPSGPNGPWKSSYSVLEPGVGIFWLHPLSDNNHVYFGPRLGYLRTKQFNGDSVSGWESTSHGYVVCPTLGFEYFPVKHVSIGGEVGYKYNKLSGSSTSAPGVSSTYRSTSNGTVTSVMVRLYF